MERDKREVDVSVTTRRSLLLPSLLAIVVILAGIPALRHGYHHYMTAIYPTDYQQEVEAAAGEFGISPSLVFAVIHTESQFDAAAVSSAGAKGLMQLTNDTFQWALRRAGDSGRFTEEDLFDPVVNIRYGVYVLSLLREQFKSADTVLAAYNAGQGRVREWLQELSTDGIHLDTIPYPETAKYVERVRQAQRQYQQLYNIE